MPTPTTPAGTPRHAAGPRLTVPAGELDTVVHDAPWGGSPAGGSTATTTGWCRLGQSFDGDYNARRTCENIKAKCPLWDYEVYADSGSFQRWRAKAASGQNRGVGR